MKARNSYQHIITFIAIVLLTFLHADAQKFSVSNFRTLSNDISAFIDPVKDLNGDDCALIKVQGSHDFVFSTPLGIVKRVDNVGEILLYIPRRSKKITIRHPQWGVLRDYQFPERIESHMTYELTLEPPMQAAERPAEIPVKVTTIRDTLIITHTDTLMITPPARVYPLVMTATAGITAGGNSLTLAPDVFLSITKRHGGFLHIATDFGSIGSTIGSCSKEGVTDNGTPFYSGKKRHSFFMINAGATHRLSNLFAIFEGAGYSSNAIAWELAPSEGGGYLRNRHYSYSGVSIEAGAMARIKRVALRASVSTVKGKQWFGSIGVGINF